MNIIYRALTLSKFKPQFSFTNDNNNWKEKSIVPYRESVCGLHFGRFYDEILWVTTSSKLKPIFSFTDDSNNRKEKSIGPHLRVLARFSLGDKKFFMILKRQITNSKVKLQILLLNDILKWKDCQGDLLMHCFRCSLRGINSVYLVVQRECRSLHSNTPPPLRWSGLFNVYQKFEKSDKSRFMEI